MNKLLLGGLALSLSYGCYVGPELGLNTGSISSDSSRDGGAVDAGGGAAVTGVPCDVQQVIAARCGSCHASTPTGGAPMPLASYADLTQPSKGDASKTVAMVAVERMQSTTRPMPPGGGPPAPEVTTVQTWIAAGYPKGTCGGADSGAAPAPSVGAGAGTDGGVGSATGVPCDVQQLMGARCLACHASTPTGGAPMPLVSYADLTKASKSDATKTVAQLSLERMQSTTRPMPPGGGTTAPELTAMQTWIAAGYPKGSCGGADSGVTVGPSPYDTPPVCTSNRFWTLGDQKSPLMHPGGACVSCHSMSDGPPMALGGTVFPTAHEPIDCNGTSAGGTAVVQITDAAGRVFTLPVNQAGNFHILAGGSPAITMPFRAKIIAHGKERVMSAAQSTGDCNSCHTEAGANGAPGRIMAP